jgi:hypothetical protein
MNVWIKNNTEYDTGIHPNITKIHFNRRVMGDFFKGNRFPDLIFLACNCNGLRKLEINSPSLRKLYCQANKLTELKLNCPSLQKLHCQANKLTELKLNAPSLQYLNCSYDKTKIEMPCYQIYPLSL